MKDYSGRNKLLRDDGEYFSPTPNNRSSKNNVKDITRHSNLAGDISPAKIKHGLLIEGLQKSGSAAKNIILKISHKRRAKYSKEGSVVKKEKKELKRVNQERSSIRKKGIYR